MAIDVLYTNGVIAAREKYLLKDKILKLCETGAEEALHTLSESGFGKGVEVTSVYEYEKLIEADERSIDEFIREYSPSAAEAAYLLSSRDFHNAKAVVKAHFLGLEAEKMLSPEGLVPVELITRCVNDGDYSALGKYLGGAVRDASALFSDETAEGVSGADIGIIFEKALFNHLSSVCAKNGLLKKLLAVKADMTNIMTALRSTQSEYAEKAYVPGGKLTSLQLSGLFSDDKERAARALSGTPYFEFCQQCLSEREDSLTLTAAERTFESFETQYFAEKKYELVKNRPFLYYVFRRRAENANVRILFVCLLAGMREQDIKARLRAY